MASQASTPSSSSSSSAQVDAGGGTIRYPPNNDQIWSAGGIMYGVLPNLHDGGKHSLVLDRRVPQVVAKVWGDNGLAPGDWFPYQMVALARGAHGQSQGGIAGSEDSGAYSIVVSRSYNAFDDDQGDIIYFSAPGSHEHTDPSDFPKTHGAKVLQVSKNKRNFVRVLRAGGNSVYAPSVGLRYDGLYIVENCETKKNDKGGIYRRYVLERVPGQPSLDSIMRASPTQQNLQEYEQIWDGNWLQ